MLTNLNLTGTSPLYVTRPLMPPKEKLFEHIEDIWSSKWLTNMGKKHIELESALKEYLRVDKLSLFCNGTIALQAALNIFCGSGGEGARGEVITTPFTFVATVSSIALCGFKPVFCDINEDSMTLNPALIEKAITNKTVGILPVHVYGIPCDVKAIDVIATKYSLPVIYDGAHVFGTQIDGTSIGNFGDATMYSFHATKLFNTIEGGAVACKLADDKHRLDLFKNFGIKSEDEVESVGTNGKMNELSAAMGLCVLKLLEDERAKRLNIKNLYAEAFKSIPGITAFPSFSKSITESLQYFGIRINASEFGATRDDVYSALRKRNIFSRRYFYPLCSNFGCYGENNPSANPANLPVANKISQEVLILPFYGGMTENDVLRVCETIGNVPC